MRPAVHMPEAEMITAGSSDRLSAIESSTVVIKWRPSNARGASPPASCSRAVWE